MFPKIIMTSNPEKAKLMQDFYRLLEEITRKKTSTFTGIGLLLYRSDYLFNIPHSPLRPSIPCPEGILLNKEETIGTLLKIADISNPLHDGFHFFDDKRVLTHVAQYFSPPIVEGIPPNEKYGGRYRAAQYGSCIDGIILTGSIDSNGEAFCFYKGKIYKCSDQSG